MNLQEALFTVLLAASGLSLAIMAVFAGISASLAALASSKSPRLDRKRHRLRMKALYNAGRWLPTPCYVVLCAALLICATAFGDSSEAFYGSLSRPLQVLAVMTLVLTPVGFVTSTACLSAAIRKRKEVADEALDRRLF